MSNFFDADADYRRAVEATGNLDCAFRLACAVGKVDLNGTDLTRAILARMSTYFTAQGRIKSFLKKCKATAAADFFVETVAFYLKAAIDIRGAKLAVASETDKPPNELIAKLIKMKANVERLQAIISSEETPAHRRSAKLQPDISVWRNADLVVAIECKTQLGWNRRKWRQDFEKREAALKQRWPNCQVFLLTMTENNWDGFGDDPLRGKQFFALLDQDHFTVDVKPSPAPVEGLLDPIEGLFRLLLNDKGKA
jgi:hypothetical protein